MPKENLLGAARHALKQAENAGRRGDLRAAERWAKNAETLSRAQEKIAAEPAPEMSMEEEETLRAELRRRLARFAEAAQESERWDKEHAEYEAQVHAAIANGTPPPAPLRPHPGGPLGTEAWLERIAKDGA